MQRKNSRMLATNFGRCVRKRTKSLLLNKKAASVVISTVILTAGVVAMSIAVLYWTYSMGKIGNIEYTKSTTTSSNSILERVGYEYIGGSGNSLTVNIINWGKTDNVTIAHVLVLDSSYNYFGSNMTRVVLKSIDDPLGNTIIPDNHLRIGGDGFFTTTLSKTLVSGQLYNVRIVTTSGRNFDGSFKAQ